MYAPGLLCVSRVFMRVSFSCCTDYRLQSFSCLSNFILSGKNVKSLQSSCSSFIHLKPAMCNSSYIGQPYRLSTSHTMRYEDFLFGSWFFKYLFLAYAYRCVAWHIPSLSSSTVSRIQRISASVSNYYYFCFVFRHACHADPGTDKIYAVSSSYISLHFSWKLSSTSANSSVSLSTTDHDTLLNFVF